MADAFTPERIAQLRKILAKATPGEWYVPSHSAVYGGATLVAITYPCSNGEDGTEAGSCTEESKANASAIAHAINTLPAALDEIERLQEANEELERNAEIVSAEFEKDCWRAMRKLLEMTGYDFTDDGVTADEAFEHLYEDFKQSERDFDQIKAELSRVAAERDSLIDQVKAMTGVSADLSRVTAERDEAGKHLWAFIRLLRHPTSAEADVCGPARAFLSRMEGRKDG